MQHVTWNSPTQPYNARALPALNAPAAPQMAYGGVKTPLAVLAAGATDFNLGGTRFADVVRCSPCDSRPCERLNHSGLGP